MLFIYIYIYIYIYQNMTKKNDKELNFQIRVFNQHFNQITLW